MSELRVNTDVLRESASVISTAANSAQQVGARICSLCNSVGDEYQGQLRDKVNSILSGVSGSGSSLQSRSQELSAGLVYKAQAIDEVMQSCFAQTASAISETNRIVSSIQGFFSSIGQLGLGIGAFILSLGHSGSSTVPVTKIPSNNPPPQTEDKFGEILKEEQKEQEAIQDWWNTHGIYQANLDIVKDLEQYGNGLNGCGEATLAMLINYWLFIHGEPTIDPIQLTKDLIDDAHQSKDFRGGTSLTPEELRDLAVKYGKKYGFQTSPVSSMTDLRNQLYHGNPVIVLVRFHKKENGIGVEGLEYEPAGSSTDFSYHYIIVTNISLGGKVTYINTLPYDTSHNLKLDPKNPSSLTTSNVPVVPQTMDVQKFEQSWMDTKNQREGFTLTPTK